MVGSTIGPSCLTIFSLLPPSLHSQTGQMVGSTIGPSCLTLFSLFLPSFPSQAGQMVGSTIGLSCLTLFSLFCLLSLPSRPDGWFYHRSVLSSSLIPASALSPLPSGPDGWFYHRSVLSYTLLPVSAFSLFPRGQMVGSTIGLSCLTLFCLFLPYLLQSGPDGWFYHRSVLSYTFLPVSAFSLLPSRPDGWFYPRSVLSYTLIPVSAFSPSQAGQMVDSTIGPSCLTLFCLFLPYLLQSGPYGWFYHFANPGDVSYTKCLELLNMHLFSFF
ncbi:hypothetical protein DPMN_131680 [Dreissena polymorpha]|uniref:Uncharacterized protein n=1 Tax=Dreissena polymorpha TaxID=45954 RepID=A0A9D4JBE5_DREPO|nr:hypothetical protein DPMN_131680 [Dreissena polymorpha]